MSVDVGFYGLAILLLLLALRAPVALSLIIVSMGGMTVRLADHHRHALLHAL